MQAQRLYNLRRIWNQRREKKENNHKSIKWNKRISNERQIDDLWDFLDEVEPKNQLSRISFATYGAGIIKGYEKVQSFIQSIVERLGGTYFSAKEELNSLFVVTLLPKRFLKVKITIWSTKIGLCQISCCFIFWPLQKRRLQTLSVPKVVPVPLIQITME